MLTKQHLYIINGVTINNSVTTLVGRLYNDFIKEFCVKFDKNSPYAFADQKKIKYSEWNLTAHIGSMIHKKIEYFLNKNECQLEIDYSWIEHNLNDSKCIDHLKNTYSFPYIENLIEKKFQSFKKYYEIYGKTLKLIATEYMIYGSVNNEIIAGTIDALFWIDETKKEVLIVDWKTNTTNIDNKKRVTKKFSPFYGQSRSKIDQYFCQLHYYAQLLKNYGVNASRGQIVHLEEDKFSIYDRNLKVACNCMISV